MHGRSAQSIDKMRRCLGGYVKSVCITRSSCGSNGNWPKQPMLWCVTSDVAPSAPRWWGKSHKPHCPGHAKRMHHGHALAYAECCSITWAWLVSCRNTLWLPMPQSPRHRPRRKYESLRGIGRSHHRQYTPTRTRWWPPQSRTSEKPKLYRPSFPSPRICATGPGDQAQSLGILA
jgi:hypothetical protein